MNYWCGARWWVELPKRNRAIPDNRQLYTFAFMKKMFPDANVIEWHDCSECREFGEHKVAA